MMPNTKGINKIGFTIVYSDGETKTTYLSLEEGRKLYELSQIPNLILLDPNKDLRKYKAYIHKEDLPKTNINWFEDAFRLLEPKKYFATLN
jgi:hypothetical protein